MRCIGILSGRRATKLAHRHVGSLLGSEGVNVGVLMVRCDSCTFLDAVTGETEV